MHHGLFRLLPLLLVAVFMALRFYRMRQQSQGGGQRQLKLEQLWVIPVVFLVLAVALFARTPPHGLGWLYAAVAVAGGAGIGWWRGSMMRITVNPVTHTLNQAASPAAIIFLVGIVALRFGARFFLMQQGGGTTGLVTDCLMAFAAAMFCTQRLEMYLRGRRLLATAQARPVRWG
jgi:hypothetical protein